MVSEVQEKPGVGHVRMSAVKDRFFVRVKLEIACRVSPEVVICVIAVGIGRNDFQTSGEIGLAVSVPV